MLSSFCCGTCCTSMATVNPSPAVCQTVCCSSGDGGSSNTQGLLNTIGKFGLTLAGQLQGRPVTVTNKGVSIGASAQYAAQQKQALTPILIIVAVAVVAFLLLSRR